MCSDHLPGEQLPLLFHISQMIHDLQSSKSDEWGMLLIQAGTVLILFLSCVVLLSAIMHAMLERR